MWVWKRPNVSRLVWVAQVAGQFCNSQEYASSQCEATLCERVRAERVGLTDALSMERNVQSFAFLLFVDTKANHRIEDLQQDE